MLSIYVVCLLGGGVVFKATNSNWLMTFSVCFSHPWYLQSCPFHSFGGGNVLWQQDYSLSFTQCVCKISITICHIVCLHLIPATTHQAGSTFLMTQKGLMRDTMSLSDFAETLCSVVQKYLKVHSNTYLPFEGCEVFQIWNLLNF